MKNLLSFIVIAGIFASCNNMNNGGNTMSNDKAAKNEARFQQFYDQVINAHNPAMVDSFCTAEFVDYTPAPGHSGKGIDDTKAEFKDWFAMFPDAHIQTNYMISKGDTIISHVTLTGTNSGSSPNMPATNKSVNYDGVDIIILKDGKATARWGYFDNMKMMAQLGMDKMGEQKMAEEGKMEQAGKKMDEKMGKMDMGKKKK